MDSLLDHAAIRPAPYRLNADQFYAMGESGILDRHARVELIEGEMVEMAPIGHAHGSAVAALTQALVLACLGRANVFVQSSLRLDAWTVPEPDFAVFRFRPDFYASGPAPTPADALLVVEVAESSLSYDKTVKRPLYARAGIPEYWIVDLNAKLVDIYRRPVGDDYTEESASKPGETIPLLADPSIQVTLDVVFA